MPQDVDSNSCPAGQHGDRETHDPHLDPRINPGWDVTGLDGRLDALDLASFQMQGRHLVVRLHTTDVYLVVLWYLI